MTIHRPDGVLRYPTESFGNEQHSYDFDAPKGGPSALQDLKLPPLRDLNLPGVSSGLQFPFRQQAFTFDASPIVPPPALSLSPSDGRSVPICPDNRAPYCRHNDGKLDIAAYKDLALRAEKIITLHYGDYTATDLEQLRADVDPHRSLFNSDVKKAKEPNTLKNGKTAKHGESERERRAAHERMHQELGKRIPNAIMALAHYKVGTAKGPGKNNLFVAALLMHEFDGLLQKKQRIEIEQLRSLLLEQAGPPSLSRSSCRHAPPPDDDVCGIESSRKRKWLPEQADVTLGGSMHLACRSKRLPEEFAYQFLHQDVAQTGGGSNLEMAHDRLHIRRAPQTQAGQQLSPPLSPSPSTTSSWFLLSRRSLSPSSAP